MKNKKAIIIFTLVIILTLTVIGVLTQKSDANAASYNTYQYLRIPNTLKNTVCGDGFKQYGFWEYYMARSDGQYIKDNNGVLDEGEIISFTWDLYIKTEPMERKPGAGFLGSTTGARVIGNGNTSIIYYPNVFTNNTTGVTPIKINDMIYPLFHDLNANPDDGKYSNNNTNPGHEFYKLYGNINYCGLGVIHAFYVTVWENCWWGGTYDETWRDLSYVTVFMKPDNEAPILSFTNINISEGTTKYSAQNVTVTSNEAYADLYVNNVKQSDNTKTFSSNGIYDLLIRDQNGNQNSYTLVIDKSRPTASWNPSSAFATVSYGTETTVNGVKTQSVSLGLTNVTVNFSFTSNPSGASAVLASYTRNGGNNTSYSSGTSLTLEGTYILTLKDKTGHTTIYNFKIDKSPPSVNEANIRDSTYYKVSKWYLVNLTAAMGGGKYSFKDYDVALSTSCSYEKAYYCTTRVLNNISDFTQTHLVAPGDTIRTGTYWQYKAESNPNIYLYYFDQEHLNRVIAKYASQYVQQPSYYRMNDTVYPNDYGTVTNSEIYQNIITVAGINAYLLPPAYIFTTTGADESKDIYYMHMEGDVYWTKFNYGTAFTIQVSLSGLYRIKESDAAGNTSYYYIFIDREAPYINIEATTYGATTIIYDTVSVADIPVSGTLAYYYETFKISEVFDYDLWHVLQIENKGVISRYVKDDEIPLLSGGVNEGGEYTITLYDRNKNSFCFKVYILGRSPKATFTNRNGNTEIEINITLGESFNTIMDLKIYKNNVLLNNPAGYDEYPDIADNELIYISPIIRNYTFTKGGTYLVEITDNFNRTVTYTYKFDKDLPRGSLSGVSDKGKAANNVIFQYNHINYSVSVKKNGEYISINETHSGELSIILIEARLDTSGIYEIWLVNNYDIDNYNIYTFEIDLIPPQILLTGVSNGGICGNEVYAFWIDEDVLTATYKINGSDMGTYRKGQILTVGGYYEIIAKDSLNNKSTVMFTIDRIVEYEIWVDGIRVEGDIYTNKSIIIKNSEVLTIELKNGNEIVHYNFGESITSEGKYFAILTDDYGNEKFLEFEIDYTLPEAYLVGVTNNCATNKQAYVEWSEENLSAIYSFNGEQAREYIKGNILSAHGKYEIVITDMAGNSISFTFRIDKIIDFSINVINGGVSNGPVTIYNNEPLKIEMKKDDSIYNYAFGQEITEEGQYQFTLEDRFGNVVTYNFQIVKMSIANFSYTVPEGYEFTGMTINGETAEADYEYGVLNLSKNGRYIVTLKNITDEKVYSFELIIDNIPPTLKLIGVDNEGWTTGEVKLENLSKQNATVTVFKDGNPYKYSSNLRIKDVGEYEIIVKDTAGNESIYRFTIVYKMTATSIVLIASLGALLTLVIVLFIVFRKGGKVS